jgi:hypothetical protein
LTCRPRPDACREKIGYAVQPGSEVNLILVVVLLLRQQLDVDRLDAEWSEQFFQIIDAL